jgi:hypothetical protein
MFITESCLLCRRTHTQAQTQARERKLIYIYIYTYLHTYVYTHRRGNRSITMYWKACAMASLTSAWMSIVQTARRPRADFALWTAAALSIQKAYRCVQVCMCVYMHACMCMYIYVEPEMIWHCGLQQPCWYIKHTGVCVCVCVYAHVGVCVYYIYIYIHIYIYIYIYIHIYVYVYKLLPCIHI